LVGCTVIGVVVSAAGYGLIYAIWPEEPGEKKRGYQSESISTNELVFWLQHCSWRIIGKVLNLLKRMWS